jgi:hypothetical protein
MQSQKISFEVFETLTGTQNYLETEINGYGVIVAWGGPKGNVIAIYYKRAGFASFSLDSETSDYIVFSEKDENWPYGG